MRPSNYIIFCFLFLAQHLCAQKNDNIWLTGGGRTLDTLGYHLGVVSMDFTDVNHPEIKRVPENETIFLYTISTVSDSLGALQFYTNGQRIENSSFEVMENGDSISNDIQLYEYGYNLYQGAIGLPHPSASTKYGLFYLVWDNIDNSYYASTTLYYNEIDMEENGGQGKVVIRNAPILVDTLEVGKMTATKHANGRDWWILLRKRQSNIFYRILFGLNGVVSVDTQQVQLTAPLANSFGQAVFSPDGSKYLTLNYGGEAAVDDVWVYFFDFDRCTGLLSGQKEWYYSDFCWSGGAAISKNSRFAYVSTSERIYQFDLWEEEPEQTFVQYRDDFVDLYPLAFNTLQLAPNGKIYGAAGTSSTYYLDVIDFPDKKGDACQIRQHGVQLPAIYNNGIPNHPNYRLGPLDGSPCDTLGLDNVPVALFRYDQDTLDYLTVEFTDLSYYEPAVWSWDFGDNTASSDASLVHNFPSSGLYEVCLTVSNQHGQDTYCRVLDLGTVATGEKKPQVDIHVFPNPCREMVNFTVTDYLPKDGSATFYDAVGRPVLKEKLVSGWNSLSLGSLPAGVYFYEVWEGGVRLKSGKVVKVG